MMKTKNKLIRFSSLFIYYNARTLDNTYKYDMKDNGTTIDAAIKGLERFGCCTEEMFPYEKRFLSRKPLPKCYTEATKYRIKEVCRVLVDINEMKACLAEGFPFVFGLQIFQSFSQANSNRGRVPKPSIEKENGERGWHAMLAVGYSNDLNCFIVRNSWGRKWVS